MGKKLVRVLIILSMLGVIVYAVVYTHITIKNGGDVSIQKNQLTGRLLNLRDAFSSSVENALGKDESSLGLAYLVGMKDGLDKSTQEMLRAVGLSHIVVASGTHLGIIVDFCKKRFLKVSRFAGLLSSIVFIVIFGQLIGWTASITRASIVAILSLVGWYYGRKMSPIRMILFAMAITLLINPFYVADLGWQLSFASFVGILIIAPILSEYFFGRKKPTEKESDWKRKAPGKISEVVMASLSATIMCVPILLYKFGTISLISLLANVLILPTIPIAMGLTFMTGIVGLLPSFFLTDIVSFLLSKITTLVLDYHLFVVRLLSEQTSLIVSIPKSNSFVFLLYVPIVIILTIWFIKKSVLRRKVRLKVWSNPGKYLPYTV